MEAIIMHAKPSHLSLSGHKTPGISPEHRQWINVWCGDNKNNTIRIAKPPGPDAEKAWALMWARKFIKREGLLTDDRIEQRYCSLVCLYVEVHGFNAEILCVTESRLAEVLAAGKKLTG